MGAFLQIFLAMEMGRLMFLFPQTMILMIWEISNKSPHMIDTTVSLIELYILSEKMSASKLREGFVYMGELGNMFNQGIEILTSM